MYKAGWSSNIQIHVISGQKRLCGIKFIQDKKNSE